MLDLKRILLAPVVDRASRLKHPQLFLVVLILFVVDVVLPDAIPFVDELMLGLITVWLANRKKD